MMNLDGKLLVASPSVSDRDMRGAVVFVFGRRGGKDSPEMLQCMTVNRPLKEITVDMIEQAMGVEPGTVATTRMRVGRGGSKEEARGFIVHTPQGTWGRTVYSSPSVEVTLSGDIVEAISKGKGPKKVFFVTGFMEWSRSRVESQIKRGEWFLIDCDPEIIFDLEDKDIYHAALGLVDMPEEVLRHTTGVHRSIVAAHA